MEYYRREWLNRPGHHEGAYILVSLEDTPNGANPMRYRFILANCDKAIKFSVRYNTQEERDNELDKLDILVEAIDGFRDALAAWYNRHPLER